MSTEQLEQLLASSRALSQALRKRLDRPHGPVAEGELRIAAGKACVSLAGDHDKGRTLWKLVASDIGYMPVAAAQALVRAANVTNLVPDIEPREPS